MEASENEWLKLQHHNDASPDVVTDLLLCGIAKPAGNATVVTTASIETDYETDYEKKNSKYPHFIILTATLERRRYKTGPDFYYSCILQLMDGTGTIIRAYTDICLTYVIGEIALIPGSTLIVTKYVPLFMNANEKSWRVVMVIIKFTLKYPPDMQDQHRCIRGNATGKRAQVTSVWICKKALEKNSKKQVVVFTCKLVVQSMVLRKEMANDMLGDGSWITNQNSRVCWVEMVVRQTGLCDDYRKIPRSDHDVGRCSCRHDYDMLQCLKEQCPVHMITKTILAGMTCSGTSMKGLLYWAELCKEDKQLSISWWYYMNILQTKNIAKPFPMCLSNYIKSIEL